MLKHAIIASDHAGFTLKKQIQEWLLEKGYSCDDKGTHTQEVPSDYPFYASQVAQSVLKAPTAVGVLICGSGMGMCIAANRFQGIRAVVCYDVTSARLARSHNNANVLVLGERLLGVYVAYDILETFLRTPFEKGHHQKRLELIDQINTFS